MSSKRTGDTGQLLIGTVCRQKDKAESSLEQDLKYPHTKSLKLLVFSH